ncbi:MAG TPA: protein phosphatase 2C domain-containing protein [Candidatus Wallbacteria bacterium]|nr:protein phosphatase 2C domain-containing protein [Candidatus Wallbacteria bacterium]
MNFKVSCKTDIGKKKANNEDNYYFCEKKGLFIVADGMGGHAGGEVASDMAVKLISEEIENADISKFNVADVIREAVAAASEKIKNVSMENDELRGMGTTLVSCLCHDEKVYVTNVGDARCYSYDGQKFELLSHDHSQIQEYIDMDLINEAQAKVHPMRHVITQAVGYNDELKIRIVPRDYRVGDYYILCSDGLNDHFESDEELGGAFIKLLDASGGDLDKICSDLIDMVNDRGGRDNITILIFKILG